MVRGTKLSPGIGQDAGCRILSVHAGASAPTRGQGRLVGERRHWTLQLPSDGLPRSCPGRQGEDNPALVVSNLSDHFPGGCAVSVQRAGGRLCQVDG